MPVYKFEVVRHIRAAAAVYAEGATLEEARAVVQAAEVDDSILCENVVMGYDGDLRWDFDYLPGAAFLVTTFNPPLSEEDANDPEVYAVTLAQHGGRVRFLPDWDDLIEARTEEG